MRKIRLTKKQRGRLYLKWAKEYATAENHNDVIPNKYLLNYWQINTGLLNEMELLAITDATHMRNIPKKVKTEWRVLGCLFCYEMTKIQKTK